MLFTCYVKNNMQKLTDINDDDDGYTNNENNDIGIHHMSEKKKLMVVMTIQSKLLLLRGKPFEMGIPGCAVCGVFA